MKFYRIVVFFLFGAVLASHGGQYFQDYTSMAVGSITFPDGDGSTLLGAQFGAPAVWGIQDATHKEFQLTANGTALTYTAVMLRDLDPGTAIYAFSARWNSQIYRTSTNDGEGFSFNFGQLEYLNSSSSVSALESGYPTGLCFSVQTSQTNNPGFYVRVNGSTLAALPYNALTQWGLLNSTRHIFEVDWSHVGGMTVRMDGQTIFTNVPTPGFDPRPGDRFVWGARTGDASSQQVRLDNIVVATGGNLVSMPMGSPFYKSDEFPPNQTADKAFDGIIASKWLVFTNLGYVGATCAFAPENVVAYSLTSAEDVQGRDPAIWKLEGSNNGGTNWTVCGNGAGFFLNRNETRTWLATNTSTFSAFRLNIATNRGAPLTQLSELKFYRFIPALAISGSNSQVILRWANTPGFNLEYRTNLSTGGWTSNGTPPTLNFNGSIYSVTNSMDTPAKFFRLRKP
jgi:hypothetical protein